MKNKKPNKPKDRDGNVLLNYKREIISLQTKSIQDKTKYTRKSKHKSEYSVRGK